MFNQLILYLALLVFVGCQASGGGGAGDIVDNHSPQEARFTVSTILNRTYQANENIDITLTFPKVVTVTGSPSLELVIGSTSRQATYTSGSGSTSLLFRYTVASGNNDLDGVSLPTTITTNGGTLTYSTSAGVQNCPLTITPPVTSGVKVDTAIPSIVSIASPPNATYLFNMPLNFSVNFSETVVVTGSPRLAFVIGSTTRYATYISGSNSSTLNFIYFVSSTDADSNGISINSSLDLNGATIRDSINNSDLTFTPPNTSGVIVAGANPIVTNVAPPSNATYLLNENLNFTLTFNKPVNVTGSPRLILTVGSSTRFATYNSGSGSNNIIFRYTVPSGDNDSNGIALANSIDLNGGSISDSSANSAILGLILPNLSGVLVSTVGATIPTITSVTFPANGRYVTGQNVDISVNFSEAVIVSPPPRIAITLSSGIVYANYFSGGGTSNLIFRYTVSSSDSDSDGISLTSPVALNGGSIQNLSLSLSADLIFTPPNGSGIQIDGITPQILSVTPPTDGTYTGNQDLDFIVNYDFPVTISGTPQLALTIGSSSVNANYLSGSGSTALTFRYTVQSGDNDTDGIAFSSPLTLNGGTISDSFGDASNLSFTGGTLPNVRIDAASPTILSINPPADATYDNGQTLSFTASFSEPITVVGTPRIAVVIGSTTRYANYISGSGTGNSVFSYTLVSADSDADGILLNSPMELNSGSLKDASGNDLVLTFTSPTTTGVLVAGNVAVAANSTITGTGPILADGVATSSVTVTLKNLANNAVTGVTPTFTATDTGSTNVYGACSVSDASGVSTCALTSTKAETKTLSIATPVVKADGTVIFTAGVPVAANSSITGSGPVIANGVATSTVTITLRDAGNNPVSGETPTFSATDSGTTNVYGACSVTDASGASTCTVSSTVAETKTLSIATPVVKADGTVIFTADVAVAANSNITGTGPVVADAAATSTITITLRDINNNPVPGQTPTFNATDTGTTNIYGACSSSNASGISTCSLASAIPEIKTLSIATPVVKADGNVSFTAGPPVAANSTITGTGPVVADGVATSIVTITLKDAGNHPVSGQTPTFTATDSGTTNVYGACSVTNASGVSTCNLTSTMAETKTLSIATPVVKADGTVMFTAGAAVAANSNISGTSPVVADGVGTSSVTITLRDASNNPVSGETPTFSATDTGTTNIYSSCSVTNASGASTCTLASTVAETKTLSIATPVVKADGTVVFTAGAAVAANSNISGTSPVIANGIATSTITITLRDANSNPVSGQTPTFSATDTGTTNIYGTCSVTSAAGESTCTLASTVAEVKNLSIATPVVKADGNVTFTAGAPVAANSTISGTSPIAADLIATSSITITLRDASNNPVPGQTPTFTATNTGTTNVYGSCSVTNPSGISTCTLASSVAETKTLSIASPIVKADGTVLFTAGAAVAANSTITASGPVIADGVAISTVTITLKDVANNPVSGQTPTFSATDTGTTNNYGSCSVTNASGVSTCSLSSTVAEIKTLSIATPVVKADGNVTFTAGAAVAASSSITGSGPVIADGVATSTVTITLRDANNNPVSSQTPTFSATDTGTTNIYGACSASNAGGVSTCTLASSTPEIKTLSISTPVLKADGNVMFTAGAPVAANSTITGSGPVIANGVATSTITITLRDAGNNPVSGQTPTFTATNTSSGNTYGSCSSSNASGISTCTLRSTKAETKTLSIVTPVVKVDGTVIFSAGSAVAANSLITGTGPVVADGIATSTVIITLRDANNNAVTAITPTFSATNTGSMNVNGACSAPNASGESTCTLKSTKAEVKTLSIATPIIKAGGTVTFTAGAPSVANSDIVGTTPVSADGVSVSFITISLADAFGNPIVGTTPIFNATDTNTTNAYGACSPTGSTGSSSCTLSSTKAEDKTLQLTSPIAVTGSAVVTFSATLPTAANSTISGTGPVIANGVATSTVTITLRDSSNNPVPGLVPTFDATDTGGTNVYDACSMSDVSGVSVCTFTSTKAEVKTLRITNPVTKSGSTVTFIAGAAAVATSSISGTGPVVADGSATSTITITLRDAFSNAISGTTPTFGATNTGSSNIQTACSSTDTSGIAICTLKSTKAEAKTPQILSPITKPGTSIQFIAGAAFAANSTISGTSPVNPDGTSTSTITITLKDAFNNDVSGITPTFSATGTLNVYGACSSSSSAGESLCTLASTTPETKTLSIDTPISKSGGTVIFQSGSAVAANSSITATGPVIANNVATSNVIISLKDSSNAPVVGIVPTFTSTGSNNSFDTCSATNTLGVSTCTFRSTKAESKTVSISAPVIKTGDTVVFTPGPASAATSTILASDPNLANGVTPATITISVLDAFSNPISGVTPTYSVSGTLNTLGDCSSTDSAGVSTCDVTSTKAEGKTVSLLTPVAVTGNTVDFNPNGIDIVVPIELLDRGLSSNTAVITFNRTLTSFDPADYVSESNAYFFEIIAENTNTTTGYNVQLVDSTNNVITDSVITVPASTVARRFRVEWTPNSGADTYRVRVSNTATASQLRVHSAKILVAQTKAVATKIYIPLSGGDVTGETNSDTGATVSSTTSTTLSQPVASNFYHWLRTDSAYDAIAVGTPWTLETVMSISNTAGTATAALFDKANNLQITGATTTLTGSTAISLRQASFASNAANFNDGDIMELRIRSGSTAHTSRLFKAGLWLKLKYLKKLELYQRLATRRSAGSSSSLPDGRFYWDPFLWSNPTVFFQTVANVTTSSVVLMRHGTNDFGTTSPTTVSTIVPTATYSRQRSSAISLVSDNRYWVQHNRTSGTVVLGGAFMVIQATE